VEFYIRRCGNGWAENYGFDLDRDFYCKAEFKEDAIYCAGLIVDNHVESTEPTKPQ